MRVTHLSARGLFSFGDPPFVLDLKDRGLSVIVGPNASGKSNLGALVDLVVTAVIWSSSVDAVSQTARSESPSDNALRRAAVYARHHHLEEGAPVEARLGVELTSQDEQELLASFMRAVIASASPATSTSRDLMQETYAATVPVDAFGALFRGEIVARHSGVAGSNWRVSYQPTERIGGADVEVLLNNYEAMLVRRDESSPDNRRSDLGVMLDFGASSSASQPTSEPPDPAVVLDRLLPEPGSATVLMVRCPTPSLEQLPEATRSFLRRASLEASLRHNSTWGPAIVWERIMRQGVRHLRAHGATLSSFDDAGLPRSQWTYTARALAEPAGPDVSDLPRRLWELHNGGPDSSRTLNAIKSEFTKLAPNWEFDVAGSFEPSVRSTEPVPLTLAVEDGPERRPVLAVPRQSVFPLPVGSGPGQSSVDLELKVHLLARRRDGNWEPLAGAGTGVAQALVLAEALGAASDRFVFLDEPAVNLHPSWQRHIRARLEALSTPDPEEGSVQFVMVTHTAGLAAPIQAGSTLPIRLIHDGTASSVIAPPRFAPQKISNGSEGHSGEAHEQTKHSRSACSRKRHDPNLPACWPKELSIATDGWGLLFADAVVLVEGETELGALPYWFDQITSERKCLPWSARNIVVFSTGGDHGFESWGRYLSHYQVPWAVVCDGIILDPYQQDTSKQKRNKTNAEHETGDSPSNEQRGLASASRAIHHWIVPVCRHILSKRTTSRTWLVRKRWVLLQVACARGDRVLKDNAKGLRTKMCPNASGIRPETPSFEEVAALAKDFGIFTLANWFAKPGKCPYPPKEVSPIESIDDLIAHDQRLRQAYCSARDILGRRPSKVRLGLYVAENSDPPDKVRALCYELLSWFGQDQVASSATLQASNVGPERQPVATGERERQWWRTLVSIALGRLRERYPLLGHAGQ